MKDYFVIRLCNKADGSVACPVTGYEGIEDAQKEYYRLCGLAVDSTHLQDSVMLVTKEGFDVKHETFAHAAPESE